MCVGIRWQEPLQNVCIGIPGMRPDCLHTPNIKDQVHPGHRWRPWNKGLHDGVMFGSQTQCHKLHPSECLVMMNKSVWFQAARWNGGLTFRVGPANTETYFCIRWKDVSWDIAHHYHLYHFRTYWLLHPSLSSSTKLTNKMYSMGRFFKRWQKTAPNWRKGSEREDIAIKVKDIFPIFSVGRIEGESIGSHRYMQWLFRD